MPDETTRYTVEIIVREEDPTTGLPIPASQETFEGAHLTDQQVDELTQSDGLSKIDQIEGGGTPTGGG